MKTAKAAKKPNPERRARANRVVMRLDDDELAAFEREAATAGVDLGSWARLSLRELAGMKTPGRGGR